MRPVYRHLCLVPCICPVSSTKPAATHLPPPRVCGHCRMHCLGCMHPTQHQQDLEPVYRHLRMVHTWPVCTCTYTCAQPGQLACCSSQALQLPKTVLCALHISLPLPNPSSEQQPPTCLHLGGVALAYAASRALQHTLLGELFLLLRLRVSPRRIRFPLPVRAGEALPGLVAGPGPGPWPRDPAGLKPW